MCICLALSSCNISLVDTTLMRKPDYDTSDKQVTLTIHKINSDTDYINIYRQETGGDEIVRGLIFPKDAPNNPMTYTFIDSLVKNGKSYKYRVRYHNPKGYYYSEWSSEITIDTILDAYDEADVLTYEDNSAKFNLDTTDYSLSLTAALIAPSAIQDFSGYKPMLVISTSTKTQLFEVDNDFIAANKSISLRGLLPLDFMDTPITISAVLGQKREYFNPTEPEEEKLITKFLSWTEPLNLKMQGHTDNIITVPSQSGAAGYDYSRHTK